MTKPQLICANLENWFCGAFWGPTFCWGSCMGLLLCSIRNGLTCWGDPTNIWSGTGSCCCCLGTKWEALRLSFVLRWWSFSLILQITLSIKLCWNLKKDFERCANWIKCLYNIQGCYTKFSKFACLLPSSWVRILITHFKLNTRFEYVYFNKYAVWVRIIW